MNVIFWQALKVFIKVFQDSTNLRARLHLQHIVVLCYV